MKKISIQIWPITTWGIIFWAGLIHTAIVWAHLFGAPRIGDLFS